MRHPARLKLVPDQIVVDPGALQDAGELDAATPLEALHPLLDALVHVQGKLRPDDASAVGERRSAQRWLLRFGVEAEKERRHEEWRQPPTVSRHPPARGP